MHWPTTTKIEPEQNVQHVYPTWGQHDTDGGECPCCPMREEVRDDDGRVVGLVVIHRERN